MRVNQVSCFVRIDGKRAKDYSVYYPSSSSGKCYIKAIQDKGFEISIHLSKYVKGEFIATAWVDGVTVHSQNFTIEGKKTMEYIRTAKFESTANVENVGRCNYVEKPMKFTLFNPIDQVTIGGGSESAVSKQYGTSIGTIDVQVAMVSATVSPDFNLNWMNEIRFHSISPEKGEEKTQNHELQEQGQASVARGHCGTHQTHRTTFGSQTSKGSMPWSEAKGPIIATFQFRYRSWDWIVSRNINKDRDYVDYMTLSQAAEHTRLRENPSEYTENASTVSKKRPREDDASGSSGPRSNVMQPARRSTRQKNNTGGVFADRTAAHNTMQSRPSVNKASQTGSLKGFGITKNTTPAQKAIGSKNKDRR